jgi:predicted transcriptional regulator
MNIQRLAVCSALRRNILMSLYADKKLLSHLRDELEISSTTAIHALKKIEKYNLTFQDNDKN